MNYIADCREIAEICVERHLNLHPMNKYTGIVTLQALVLLAIATGDEKLKNRCVELLSPFYSGKVTEVEGIYDKLYRCGGNAAAWLVKAGCVQDILPVLVSHARELIANHPRDSHGVFSVPELPERVWIDTAFAVCPFLCMLGNLTGESGFFDEACHQIMEMHELLVNKDNGLYHQTISFIKPAKTSDDHWSRGNGWAALALADMAVELPESYKHSTTIREMYRELMFACVKTQDAEGLWHQEMTRHDSYVETSGSGLILYAIGRGLNNALLDAPLELVFRRGLRGYLSYIACDGSVFNTCRGCCCPGDGSIAAYMDHPWVLNDPHAFGPVALTFSQALLLGIHDISLE